MPGVLLKLFKLTQYIIERIDLNKFHIKIWPYFELKGGNFLRNIFIAKYLKVDPLIPCPKVF